MQYNFLSLGEITDELINTTEGRKCQQKEDSTTLLLEEQREAVVLLRPGFPKKAETRQDCLADNGAM